VTSLEAARDTAPSRPRPRIAARGKEG
jgi:hypothetical protein